MIAYSSSELSLSIMIGEEELDEEEEQAKEDDEDEEEEEKDDDEEEDENEEEEEPVGGDGLIRGDGEGRCNWTGCAEIASSASRGVIFANSSSEGNGGEDGVGGVEVEEDVEREEVLTSLSDAIAISAERRLL